MLWTDPGEATGDDARSLGAGDANGVAHRLGGGESARTREGHAALVERVCAGAATDADAEVGEVSGEDMSPVIEIGIGGGAGSSNTTHRSSLPSQPTQRRWGLQTAGAL